MRAGVLVAQLPPVFLVGGTLQAAVCDWLGASVPRVDPCPDSDSHGDVRWYC